MKKEEIFMKSAGTRGYSPLARVLTAIVMMFTLATTGAWAQEGTLLTTITPDGNGNPVYTVADVATLDKGGADYSSDWAWYKGGQAWLTITPAANVTITKVKFTTNAGDSWEDTEAPFQAKLNGLWVYDDKGNNMDNGEGVSKIEVYGYTPQTYTVTMAEGTVDATNWTISPTEAAEGKPVTATYSGTKHVKSVTAVVKAAAPAALTLNLTSPAVGQVIGSDGKNYAYASLPTGVTALARICYVNGSKGLAMAMADEGKMAWSAAITTCEAHTPAFANGTWKLPTKAEWDNMISASGGVSTLREAFSGIGGDNLQYVRYWSATVDESNDSNAYNILINDGTWATFVKTNVYRYVRAVLAW